MIKKVNFLTLILCSTFAYADLAPEYTPITTDEVNALTKGQSLSALLPPGYKEPLLDGLASTDGVKTLWGSKPEFDTIVSTAAYKDPLPELNVSTSLELKKASLSTVFSSLARDMKISYITTEDVPSSEITASFSNMTATDIFRSLAAQQNLEVVEYFGAFALREKQTPPLILRKYKLDFNYIDAGDTMEAVGAQLENNSSMSSGSGGGQSMGSGMGSISKSLKADYSEFIENIKSLAKLDLTSAKSATDIKSADKTKKSSQSSGGTGGKEDSLVIYDPDNRTLLVQATWAGHEAIMTYLETINSPQENVAIEIFVAETSLNPTTDLGVNWSFASESGFTVAYNPAGADYTDNGREFTLGRFSMDNVSATIKALQGDKQGRSYSHPRVLTTNNRSVTLESVVEVPYTSSNSSVIEGSGGRTDSNSTDFKRVGITISVVPIIQGNDILRLKVSVTNSTLQGYDEEGEPITSVRSYGGAFSLNSGEYIIIGGLGENRYMNTQTGVAFLQSIPYLGNLFGSSNISNETKNLLIFIRPVIKKQFRKGLDVTTMDKGALFANSNKWPMLFNPNDVIFSSNPKSAKDPFATSDMNNVMHTFNADDIKKAKDAGAMGLRIIDGTSGEDKIIETTLPLPKESTPEIKSISPQKAPVQIDGGDPISIIHTNEETYTPGSYDDLLQKSMMLSRKLQQLKVELGSDTPRTITPNTPSALPAVPTLTPIPVTPVPPTKDTIDGNSHNVTIQVSSGSPITTVVDENVRPVVNGAGNASDKPVVPAITPQPIYLKK